MERRRRREAQRANGFDGAIGRIDEEHRQRIVTHHRLHSLHRRVEDIVEIQGGRQGLGDALQREEQRVGFGQTADPVERQLLLACSFEAGAVGQSAGECDQPDSFGQQQAEIVHGLTEPFGIAIDNARMLGRIRTLAADEERSRIARDLHDHIGSSLAMIGYEVDRARSIAADGGEIIPVLEDLRAQITAVVSDVRDTLFDLRTEVTDTYDLASIVRDFLTRVQQRTGIVTDHEVRIAGRLPLMQERELWQIAREAITNVERHSQAKNLTVTVNETTTSASISVRDDGVGLGVHTSRADSYGIIGMRERAARIGAELSIRPSVRGGTEIQVHLRSDDRRQRWDSR